MMRHPFHEIVDDSALAEHSLADNRPDDNSSSNRLRSDEARGLPRGHIGRRGFFAGLLAALAGLAAYAIGREAQAWPPWQRRRSGRSYREYGRGEGREIDDDRRITTQAIGEEGGGQRPPRDSTHPGPITTQAIGEEGGQRPGPITTQAIGEEGSGYRPPREPPPRATPENDARPPRDQPSGAGRITTQALGEEG